MANPIGNTRTDSMANTRWLLLCGAIGSPLFVVVFSVMSAIRPNYDAFRQNVSSLEIGELGWVQVANFIATGLLFVAFAVGLRRVFRPMGGRWQPLLVGLVGLGLVGAGLFTPDRHPLLHDICSAPVFFGLIAACVAFAWLFFKRGAVSWTIYSLLTAVGVLTTLVLSFLGFGQHPLFVGFAGLWQRVSIVIGWSWIMLLAVAAVRDREAVERLIRELVNSWNQRDAPGFALLFSPFAEYVAGDGSRSAGRDHIAAFLHERTPTSVVRVVGGVGVEVLGSTGTAAFRWSSDGSRERQGTITCAVRRTARGWLIDRLRNDEDTSPLSEAKAAD